MFNLFKKRKKPSTPEKTQEQYAPERKKYYADSDSIIACEMAEELIRDVQGILVRYEYWLRKLGKDQTAEEKAHIAWVEKRRSELAEEKRNVQYGDDQIPRNNKIREVYGALVRDYFALPESGEDVAKMGLPERFVTTKVDLSEFDEEKGEKDGLS